MDPRFRTNMQRVDTDRQQSVLQLRNAGNLSRRVAPQRQTVSVDQLLVPYPQYGGITQTGTDLRSARYQSFQLRVQRSFAHGFHLPCDLCPRVDQVGMVLRSAG